ncbi:hypothetical protein [Vibrio phage VpKK5]|uniref:head closure Hc1 n=1 Tax=Vibrio phage VpKK5 TaxID=1538804 RepID=UPI0004F91636|nr:head closure Hc1 [Vibrio phage VpKK5]AIM40554.1 hypothetical protein [Vibrio phage VpKK5]
MSDQFYIDLRTEATEVINEFGTQFTVHAEGEYDPAEGGETEAGPTRSVTGVVADQQVAMALTDGTGMAWHAKKSLILTADADPKEGEEVEVDGKRFPMTALEPVKPANIVVIYMLDLTR